MTNWSDPASKKARTETGCAILRKPRILLGACGSVDAVKFGHVCRCFAEWAEIRAVVTKASLRFIDEQTFPKDVVVFCDEHEWNTWRRIGDGVLHIELHNWAEIMVIAPLSANTLHKIARGLCDNLLTCIVRAWDYNKPFFVAPSMNSITWKNPFTEQHCTEIDDLGVTLIPPVMHTTASGDFEHGSMADPSTICSTMRVFYESKMQKKNLDHA